jgi:hypothetical protein
MGRKSSLSSLLSIHLSLLCRYAGNQVHSYFAELFERGFEVLEDLKAGDFSGPKLRASRDPDQANEVRKPSARVHKDSH